MLGFYGKTGVIVHRYDTLTETGLLVKTTKARGCGLFIGVLRGRSFLFD